ncbi:hypothetical protein [Serratia fonticola]|uniref:hypothetical protein n=1 Tax=Serratia fonticola TaxID=47917 RepID=UPI0009394A9C|nr:hypothetical protein [Serratia fonticola]OKP31373.1 hypothetical protein BSQ40_00480 [Serratia fonticola]
MKTLEELQRVVGYEQTQDYFLEYIALLVEREVIDKPGADDIIIDSKGVAHVSCEFFNRMTDVYGVTEK